MEKLKESIGTSFVIIALLAAALTAAAFAALDVTLRLLQVPAENYDLMRAYLLVIFVGIPATFLYNYFACLLRSVGNSVIPLVFLGVSAVTNIVLDLLFVVEFEWGVEGAAWATVIAQYLSGVGLVVYTALHFSYLRPQRHHFRLKRENIREISQFAFLTCAQQSVMNFGILMVQGRVNYFGPAVMAAFAAAVKIDSFAYMPVQDFGNAFSTFIAQNYGARAAGTDPPRHSFRRWQRHGVLHNSFRRRVLVGKASHDDLIDASEAEILSIGVTYLRIEGAFYLGIGFLSLLYGLYRAIARQS